MSIGLSGAFSPLGATIARRGTIGGAAGDPTRAQKLPQARCNWASGTTTEIDEKDTFDIMSLMDDPENKGLSQSMSWGVLQASMTAAGHLRGLGRRLRKIAGMGEQH